MKNLWYVDPVELKVTEKCMASGYLAQTSKKLIQRKSEKFVLVEDDSAGLETGLTYRQKHVIRTNELVDIMSFNAWRSIHSRWLTRRILVYWTLFVDLASSCSK